MNKNNTNTIEIKGQLYDAISGAPIQAAPKAQSSAADKEVLSTATPNQKHPVNEVNRHAPKTSQILMRSAVKKPDPSLKRRIRISESTERAITPIPITEKSSLTRLAVQRPDRAQRAALFKQSELISHSFVAPSERPAAQSEDPIAEAPRPVPQITPPAPPKSPADLLLQRGLSQATAHEQPPLPLEKSGWPRASLVAIPVVGVVLALLIFGSHTFTSLQLRIASAKAGFSTNLPTYYPVGFTLDQMSYNSGIFASDFYAKNSDQSYTITQKSSSWNTQNLLNNYVSFVAPNYKVIQLGARTIYLYGNGDATWVSGHMWYQIDSDGSLKEAQIIDVANSL